MSVFVVESGERYEGSWIEGIYASEQAARQAVAIIAANDEMAQYVEQPLSDWQRETDTIAYFESQEWGMFVRICSYAVQSAPAYAPPSAHLNGQTFGALLDKALGEETEEHEEPGERSTRPRWRYHCGCASCNGRTWKRFRQTQYRPVKVA